jgi:hypothetical protein
LNLLNRRKVLAVATNAIKTYKENEESYCKWQNFLLKYAEDTDQLYIKYWSTITVIKKIYNLLLQYHLVNDFYFNLDYGLKEKQDHNYFTGVYVVLFYLVG